MSDLSSKTILIAEDEAINFNLLSIILKPTKVKIIWVKNGLEAVEIFNKNQDIDAILMDIQMPVMDGYEAVCKIRDKNKIIPIIVITADTSAELISKVYKAGANEFIAKPINVNDFINLLKNHLG